MGCIGGRDWGPIDIAENAGIGNSAWRSAKR